jgi:hypothetical protein
MNKELSKLLVSPLYGNDPRYGVRELVQNATDACKERMKIEETRGNVAYTPLVTVSIDKINEEQYRFKIEDNGKGMTLDEILSYFLSIGSSFRKSYQWKKEFMSEDGKSLVKRNGKFGIGVLAAFLLGDELSVKTRSYKDDYTNAYSFSAGINSEYIDVKKIETVDIGTTIEILMSNEKYALLTHEKHSRAGEISWTGWYINKIPCIKYFFNEKNVSAQNYDDSYIARNIFPENFDNIQWGYKKHTYYYYYHDMFIACNDIIITLSSKKSKFHYIDNENTSKKDIVRYVIDEKPCLKIEDSNGILPLKLDRNDLDEDTLPFEKELLLDVSKDFIAQLLNLPFKLGVIEKYIIKPHNTEFLFLENGFMLISDYFMNMISTNFSLLRIIINNEIINNTSSILEKLDNIIIYPKFSTPINLTDQKENVAPEAGGCILLPKEKYNNLFKERKRIPAWIKHNHRIEWETENYVVYTFNKYKAKSNLFDRETCISIMEILKENVQSIQEVPFGILDKIKGGEILDGLFEKYFKDNIIIPYDMDKRKSLYPLAFEELKDYMKVYEKQQKNKKSESES